MRSHVIWGPLQLSKSSWTTRFWGLHVDFRNSLISIRLPILGWGKVHWEGGRWEENRRHPMITDILNDFPKSRWSVLLCCYIESKSSEAFNKLFRNPPTYRKVLQHWLRQKDVSFWHTSFSHKKEKHMKNHEGSRMRSKNGICGTKNAHYFLKLTFTPDFARAGPFCPCYHLFSLFIWDDKNIAKTKQRGYYVALSVMKSTYDISRNILYILAPQEFPNSRNPIRRNMTWVFTKKELPS